MKTWILIIVVLCLFSCTGKHVVKTPVEDTLEGSVKATTESIYSVSEKFGEIQKDSMIRKVICSYDRLGKKISEKWYKPDGRLECERTGIYNDKGNKVEEHDTFWLEKRTTYKYDENDRSIEEIRYFSDGTSDRHTFKYNNRGNILEHIWYWTNGKFDSKWIYKYDENGDLIDDSRYSADGSLSHRVTYKRDKKGNVIEEIEFESDKSIKNKHIYKYDYKGNLVKTISYSGNGKELNVEGATETIYKYDSKGNVVTESKSSDSGLIPNTTYRYDERGNKIEEVHYDSSGNVKSKENFEYDEYDNVGNWKRKRKSENENLNTITERVIEYY